MRVLYGFNSNRTLDAVFFGVCLTLTACDNYITHNPPPPAVSGTIAFQHVRVITMFGNEVLIDQTVLVDGGRIQAVGPSGNLEIPPNTLLIADDGLTLMPGLADMHAHYDGQGIAPLFLIIGITTVRVPWGTGDQVTFDTRAKAGKLAGPNTYSSGPLMDGPNPVHEGSVIIATPEAAVAAVNAQYEEGYRGIKLYERLSKDVYKAAVEAAKAKGMWVSSHTPSAMQVEDLLELKIDSIEHLEGYGESLSRGQYDSSKFGAFVLWRESWRHVNDAAIETLARKTAASGVWNVPDLTPKLDPPL